MRTFHCFMSLAAALAVIAVPALAEQYSFSTVGPSGVNGAQLFDISNNGTIIWRNVLAVPMVSERNREPVPFTIAGTTNALFMGINSSETVAGNLTFAGVGSPFISNLAGTKWRTLPNVDGFATFVNGISNNGLVFANRAGSMGVGVVIDTRKGDDVTYVIYPDSFQTSILGGNDNGFLFGTASTNNGSIRWKWQHGVFEDLILPPGVPADAAIAGDTNNSGDLILTWNTQPDGIGHTGILRANGDFEELVFPGIAETLLAITPPSAISGGIVLTQVPGKYRVTGGGMNDRGDVVGQLLQAYTGTRPDGSTVTQYRIANVGFLASKGAGGN